MLMNKKLIARALVMLPIFYFVWMRNGQMGYSPAFANLSQCNKAAAHLVADVSGAQAGACVDSTK